MRLQRYGLRKRATAEGKVNDRASKRAWGRAKHGEEAGETSRRGPGRSRKMKETVTDRVRKAEQAFLRFSNQAVRRVMQKLEEEATQDQSDEEVEDWTFLLHDPGQTRGRMSLYKQSLHLYWVMKGILAKALLQVSKEMVNLAKGGPDIRLELSFLRVAMLKQEEAMMRMEEKLTTIQHILTPEQQEQVTEAMQQPVICDKYS